MNTFYVLILHEHVGGIFYYAKPVMVTTVVFVHLQLTLVLNAVVEQVNKHEDALKDSSKVLELQSWTDGALSHKRIVTPDGVNTYQFKNKDIS